MLFTRETAISEAAQQIPGVREHLLEMRNRVWAYAQRLDEEFERLDRELDQMQNELNSRRLSPLSEQVACYSHHLDAALGAYFTTEFDRLWNEQIHISPLDEVLRSVRTEGCQQCSSNREALSSVQPTIDWSSQVTVPVNPEDWGEFTMV
jgi:hypothetical protein